MLSFFKKSSKESFYDKEARIREIEAEIPVKIDVLKKEIKEAEECAEFSNLSIKELQWIHLQGFYVTKSSYPDNSGSLAVIRTITYYHVYK